MTTPITLDTGSLGVRTPGLRPWTTWLALFALFALFASALACISWDAIRAVNHESSDFAANTLLVLDAKRFQLIHGHYSRIGFNHPGPALLYVLAFGELLFYDLLRVVPSPFSGQLLAVDFYNAAWLTAIVAMVRRMAGGLLPALLFGAAAVLVFTWCDRAILGGMWFPHLFVLPYAALLVALAPLLRGRADTLMPLALATGFLVNGHASFIPMLGVVLVLVLLANAALARHGLAPSARPAPAPAQRILRRVWFVQHGRALLAAGAILLLFFVPLIIATVKDFPGPLHDYLRFGRTSKTNTLGEAARFVGVYWGLGHGTPARGAAAWGLALPVVLAIGLGRVPAGLACDARALGIVFLVSTLSVLYYAKAGVDMLDQIYLAVFYFAVPALAAGLLVLVGYQSIRTQAREALAKGLIVLALAGAWHWLRVPPDYVYFYNHANVAALYEQVRKLPGSGRVVLDLDQDPATWGDVWGNTLGLLAYAKRQGVDLACVNAHWHISFTPARRCRPEEVAGPRRYTVRFSDAPDPVRGEPDAEGQGLALFRTGAPPRPFAYLTVEAQPGYFREVLGEGWSVIEGDFVWSDGPRAELKLPADPQRGRMLTLDLGSFIPDNKTQIKLQAVVNGKPAGGWAFNLAERRRRIVLDLGQDPGAAQRIELKIDKPLRPIDYGMGQDGRLLGVSLYGIKKGWTP